VERGTTPVITAPGDLGVKTCAGLCGLGLRPVLAAPGAGYPASCLRWEGDVGAPGQAAGQPGGCGGGVERLADHLTLALSAEGGSGC